MKGHPPDSHLELRILILLLFESCCLGIEIFYDSEALF